jgi:hypothetical protein
VRACAPFSPEEESTSISEMLFFISDYRRRTKSINSLNLSVINKVLFNVALSATGWPVPSAVMHNTVQLFATLSAESKIFHPAAIQFRIYFDGKLRNTI